MQIYWNKRKCLHKKRVQLPGDWFGTPIWPPWRHVKTFYKSHLGPGHTYPDIFENGEFFQRLKKIYASLRSVFESFSPVLTKTLQRCKYDSVTYGACVMLEVYDIIVFENLRFRPSTRKWKAGVFKTLHSGERFLKRSIFGVTVFTGCVWTVGKTGGKNIRFQTKTGLCLKLTFS